MMMTTWRILLMPPGVAVGCGDVAGWLVQAAQRVASATAIHAVFSHER